jgi:hypothetical protein
VNFFFDFLLSLIYLPSTLANEKKRQGLSKLKATASSISAKLSSSNKVALAPSVVHSSSVDTHSHTITQTQLTQQHLSAEQDTTTRLMPLE